MIPQPRFVVPTFRPHPGTVYHISAVHAPGLSKTVVSNGQAKGLPCRYDLAELKLMDTKSGRTYQCYGRDGFST